ncbi:2-hydroxychromene-2-carboxylate isomerase [Leptospira ilyithenensis]|uniref:2-hydroxychromene-2-carboxylate isomerase n=1 Tax=Leptospira ilyithenensis TaxID=2484901 RepID=A0A4R9LWD5_9LEPT|nr:2-hydroxychromene-2-carboxylate isomerase [Leptospira ilyithenensis]TGN13432.1 2-hydroxychromene-2-carboxylate isomerase [Leptospira ilyithenensis]
MKTIDFYFDFGSTYSFLSVMRISDLAKQYDRQVVYRPILLGPIFKSLGWETSPFNMYPIKGRYMWRDLERRAEKWKIKFRKPDIFPANGLQAARVAVANAKESWCVRFIQEVFRANFELNLDISKEEVLISILRQVQNSDPRSILQSSVEPSNKDKLRQETELAQKRGIFGAPSFFIQEEMFWGDDRLEDAFEWGTGKN